MRIGKFFLSIIVLAAVMGCDNDEGPESRDITVDTYIELLRTNQCTAHELPAFTHEDIPALLGYRYESQIISDFPTNPISSYWLAECRLGMYVLWTIESIRAVATESEFLIGRFPSLNPIVQKRQEDASPEQGEAVHNMISQAYFDWWESNKLQDFEQFKDIDPLMDTEYRWH